MHMTALAIDLFCGLGGWTEGLLAEGYDVVGFDVERHEYGAEKYPAQLVLQDVTTIHGKQFRDAALIVASPPCQEFSYMAMPWSRAKAKQSAIEADTTGAERARLTALFDACFRIQREAIAASGRYIPMVVENVRGANKWVGRSRWNYGSFHLWGDVPALMPMDKAIKNTGGSWFGINPDGTAGAVNNPRDGIKRPGMNWSGSDKPGYVAEAFNSTKVAGFRFDGSAQTPSRSCQSAAVAETGVKQPGISGARANGSPGQKVTNQNPVHELTGIKVASEDGERRTALGKGARFTTRHGQARKAASARIAKIPLALSRHIAAYWKPRI